MIYTTCETCNNKLEIEENDYMPGCREIEEIYCPICKTTLVAKVFTSGIPKVSVIPTSKKDKDEKKES